ncbi:riboflavin synthase [Clostridium aminobutyricum]|uniref:Riboflavin synthase n=1 Tax=Clostridium aminobutyricum TaxID=33953 RepID=A0A939D6K4_CLOAM|nr:riboflavin synthase [Clostridium aminobutyricum]MBN7772172.1 riboflavin synthase [Clostridium aminobutyricum]
MFTGIIEEKGRIKSIGVGRNSSRLTIEGDKIFDQIQIGDSVAVNGVCLTVCTLSGKTFEADVMGETISRSSLGGLKPGSCVNLERAMAANGRFGGHIVSGHIDGTGRIVSLTPDEIATWVKISAPPSLMRYIVEKGSIAIDGISLTVAKVEPDSFQVSLIPHTGSETTLLDKRPGDIVNLENDIIGKYIEKLMGLEHRKEKNKSSITMDFLAKNGF